MDEKNLSTLSFRSNLQPVREKIIKDDKHFLSFVRDPFGLEMLRKVQGYAFTSVQSKEFRRASVHCVNAFEDDYPWGTIVDDEGKEKVVCKCINRNCMHFRECRPDFDESELISAVKNVQFEERVAEGLKAFELSGDADTDERERNTAGEGHGDAIAAASLFKVKVELKVAEEVQSKNAEEMGVAEPEKISVVSDNGSLKDIPAASFDSFVMKNQRDIIEADPKERIIINAGPGTGKTWSLIEKIRYMLTVLEVEPQNILVLCFSRAAAEVIRERLEKAAEQGKLPLNWHMTDVRTFDSFATCMLAWVQENIPDLLPQKYLLEAQNYEQRIKMAGNILAAEKDMLAEYEHVIIDEVQDLVGSRAEMVLALLKGLPDACGFTLSGDSCQAIYDYLSGNDNKVMSSTEFYSQIFSEFREAQYIALAHNYRQDDVFGMLTVPYRESILSEKGGERIKEARLLNEKIAASDVNLQRFSRNDAEKFLKKGSLGILTRTNGQALQISAWLRTEGIGHLLQKPVNSVDLAEWISRVFNNAETDVLDKREFEYIFKGLYPGVSTGVAAYWDALISTQRDEEKTHYETEDLLRGLMRNARHPLLFKEPERAESDIVVSNIHRAKGKEFDSVLVLEDVIESMTEEENDDVSEHKVCYVALTRPKKSVEKVHLKKCRILVSRDEYRKCFRAGGFGNRRYLSHYEIGDSIDLNIRSFARDKETQRFLQKEIQPDTRLKLLKCPENTDYYITYKIVLEENENRVLGYTSKEFASGMEKAIQRVFSNYRSIEFKYFPNIFGDIYFEGLTTCISTVGENIPGAAKIGNMYFWNGISVSGFAQMEKDRY